MDAPQTPQFALEGKELLDHLAERAAQNAQAAVLVREERRNRTLMTVVTVLGLVGVGALVGGLKMIVAQEMVGVQAQVEKLESQLQSDADARATRLRDELSEQVRAAVLAELDAQIGEVQTKLAQNDQFEAYTELAMRLPEQLSGIHRRQDKYVAASVAHAIEAVRALADRPELTSRTRFAMATREIVKQLTRYNRIAEINELDALIGDVMADDAELSAALVDHYGQLVIGSPLPIEQHAADVERLRRYAAAAGQLNHGNKRLLWQLFLEFKQHEYQPTATTTRLLESTRDLSPDDKIDFWYEMFTYSDPTLWLLVPDQQGRELQRLVLALAERYPAVEEAMETNLRENPHLQENVAARRAQIQTIFARSGESRRRTDADESEPPESQATREANELRR